MSTNIKIIFIYFYLCSCFVLITYNVDFKNIMRTSTFDCINAIDNHSQVIALAMCVLHSLTISHAELT